jgi:ligand-binding sensor domain-containing protein/DNA-binding CsgD family transcriptional regulator
MNPVLLHKKFFIKLFLLIACKISLAQNIPVTPLKIHFEASQYHGGIQNWSFDQDSSDVLYVANNDGLLAFNGADWKRYDIPHSTKTRAVHVGFDHKIYVGCQGQIGYFDNSESGLKFTSLLEKLPKSEREISETWSIFEFQKRIYFNTLSKLLEFDNGTLRSIKLPHPIQRAFSCNGKLIVQFKDKGLFQYSNEKFQPIPNSQQAHHEVIAALPQNDKLLFIDSNGGVFRMSTESFEKIKTPLSDNIINNAIRLSNGDYAVGTQTKGLIILTPDLKLKQSLIRNQGVTNQTVISLYEDHFQNLWAGLHNGIDYLELNSPFHLINEQVGLEGTGYASIYHNGALYLGTNQGLFKEVDGRFVFMTNSEGQVNNLSIVGGKLFLNHHRGAFEVKDRSVEKMSSIGSWKFMESEDDRVVLEGTYDGIIIHQQLNEQWQPINKVRDLVESSRIMEFENDSTIWMTQGYKGAYRIQMDKNLKKTKSVTHYGIKNGFPSNTLISVYQMDNQLVFTGASGIYDYHVESDTFKLNQSLSKILGKEHVSKLTMGENGDIYYIGGRKIGRLRPISFGNYDKESEAFKRVNKYLSDDLESISIIDQKNILFGAKGGFIHYDPSKEVLIKEKYQALINSVSVVNEDNTETFSHFYFGKKNLAYDDGITFEFSSPYFDGFEDIQFAYRLSEKDKWSDWTHTRTKEYNRLPPGKYTFQVKAKNIYGMESKPASVSFSVKSPWYSNSLAISIYFLGGLLLFTLTPALQRKKHKSETERIVKDKEQALRDRDQRIDEITEKSNQEIYQLRNEKLRSEISLKNGQLSSVTTHLLQKNELLKEILKSVETATDNLDKGELRKVIKSINRNLSDDASWDQFATHFDQVHGDFLKKLANSVTKLTPQETKLAAYLRMNMSSKEIANLMNVSVRGVELARYRLRKKLGLDRDQNLNDYLMQV